jgi:hypothetical protein
MKHMVAPLVWHLMEPYGMGLTEAEKAPAAEKSLT